MLFRSYDPRKDGTAGGSGAQRWDNPATWAFSDNNMVIVYNIMRGIYYAGQHVWGGRASAYQLPYANWAAAMDACDELVTLNAGGTEKRFRGGREIFVNERPADVISEFLIGANARICPTAAGLIYVLVGVPDEADGTFTDDDVLVTEGATFTPFGNLDSIINGATATYREPAQAWEDKETAPYYRADLETEDGGPRRTEGLTLSTTFSGTQAQRVQQAVVEESRRFAKHVLPFPPRFGRYRVLQTLAWSSEENGYGEKLFLITAKTEDEWGNVVLGLQEIDPTDHDWNPGTDERPLSFTPMTPVAPAPQPVSGYYVLPAIVMDGAGNPRRPAIDVFWSVASVTVDVQAVRITVVLDDAGLPGDLVWEGSVPRPILGSARLTEALLPAEEYLVQIQYMAASGRPMLASSWLPVTTPDVRLGADDVTIELGELAGDVLADFGANQRRLIEAFRTIGTLLEESDRENFTERKTLNREIRLQLGDLEAGFTEIIEVALGPGGAIALKLDSLYAAMGGNNSAVNVKWEAVAAPAGYSARYAVQAAVNDGTFRAATFFLDVPADPSKPTRIGFMAGNTVFYLADGTPIALFDETGIQRSANGKILIDWVNGLIRVST